MRNFLKARGLNCVSFKFCFFPPLSIYIIVSFSSSKNFLSKFFEGKLNPVSN